MKITIYNRHYNGLELEIQEGSNYVENFDETLDSADVAVRNLDYHLDIEPMDYCFYGDTGMIIASYNEKQIGVYPEIYDYEISLVSPTKIFEGIIAPNLSITKSNVRQPSVKEYIERYFDLYVKKTKFSFSTETEEMTIPAEARGHHEYYSYDIEKDGLPFTKVTAEKDIPSGNITTSWEIDPDDATKVKIRVQISGLTPIIVEQDVNITLHLQYSKGDDRYEITPTNRFQTICPEFQWNTPTLREIFNDLMMVEDCIPKASLRKDADGIKVVLGFLDLSQTNGIINYTKEINYINRSQTLDNYASNLRMDMQNVLQTQVDGVRNEIETSEFVHFSAPDFIVTDQNFYLETQFPILEVKKLEMLVFRKLISGYGDDIRPILVDMTQAVKEYQEYITLPVVNHWNNETAQEAINNHDISKWQNFALYYSRGDNKIQNFSRLTGQFTKSWLQRMNLYFWMKFVFPSMYPGYVFNDIETQNTYFSSLFKVTYTTQTDQIFTAGRTLGHERTIQDNQTNSWVDAYSQGFLEYLKVKRLSNQIINLCQINTTSPKLAIGDVFERDGNKYIVYQVQSQNFKNYSQVNAYAAKDYVMRNYWTGISSRIRTWKNATDEALIRHELEKKYLELSFTNNRGDFESWQLGALNNHNSIKFVQLKTYQKDNTQITNVIGQMISRLIGDSIVFTFGFNDNTFVGNRVSSNLETDDIEVAGVSGADGNAVVRIKTGIDDISRYGINLEPIPYVETQDYSFYNIEYILGSEIHYPANPEDIEDKDDIKAFMVANLSLPQAGINTYVIPTITGSKVIFKDNREIFKMSLQYEYYTDSPDIYFTKLWLEYNTAIRNLTKPSISCVFSSWEYNRKLASGESVSFSVNDNVISFNGNFTKGDGIYIIDSNTNEVLLGFKAQSAESTNLYLNVKNSRVLE